MKNVFAALFDWDGVIVDSSRLHEESWERLAQEEGKVLPEGHFLKGFGMKNAYIIPHQHGWTQDPREITRLSLRKEALYRELVAEKGLSLLPGAEQWLDSLMEAGIPCVVGSSTEKANIELVLEQNGMADRFRGIVASEDVSHGKPDPEVFLKAAAVAGIEPSRSVVFEDAFVGIDAARSGGMKVVAVATTNPRQSLEGKADLVVSHLGELSLEQVAALFPKV